MSLTPKKGNPFVTCEKCTSIITQRDSAVHDGQCPPSETDWSHGYIKKGILHSTVEPYSSQELPKNISERDTHDMVFLSQSVLQICQIAIGDRVLISSKSGAIVRRAWPMTDKTLTSVCLTRNTIETSKIEGAVKIKKFDLTLPVAKEIEVQLTGKSKIQVNSELQVLLRFQNEKKALCVDNRISLPFYGKNLIFKITKITEDKEKNNGRKSGIEDAFSHLNLLETPQKFFETLYSTKWVVIREEEAKPSRKFQSDINLKEIGGYHELIEELKDIMDIVLQKAKSLKGLKISKGILLYGTEGVGKSSITSAILSEYDVNVFPINATDITSRFIEKPEAYIKEIFSDAKKEAPSIILIEEIDSLCPKKSGNSSENDKKVLGTLINELNDLQKSDAATLLWSTATSPEVVHPTLRRPGRIDREFEVPAPTPQMRKEMLRKLTSKLPHVLTQEDIDQVAFITHGFVAADLSSLCSQAAMNATKRHRSEPQDRDIKINFEDFTYALTHVKPSAMKEVLVEIPNVKWADIGGQKDLKLKLQQAVEWPLRHPEAFSRLGITPPRGVLMFGPPGCSKTMVARALATESKLNFINIKGPELFSKWVGESEKAVREVFRKARQVAPSIVFIDEIDALGGERSSGSASAGNQVQERVLAQLLTELDGVTALGNVTLVAATNRPDRIDKALLRPGRLDRIVYVPLPDYETRVEIFEIKFRKMPIDEDVNIRDLVDLTEGYSGAEVQAVCHEAAFKALEDDLDASKVTKKHFKAALATVKPRTPRSLIDMYEEYVNKIEN